MTAFLRGTCAVLQIACDDLIDLIVLRIAGTDDESRKYHYGIESVKGNALHDVSGSVCFGLCVLAVNLVAVEVHLETVRYGLGIDRVRRAQINEFADLTLETHVGNVLGTDNVDSSHRKICLVREGDILIRMEKDRASRIFEIKELFHGILVRGNTVLDLNVRVASVDRNI